MPFSRRSVLGMSAALASPMPALASRPQTNVVFGPFPPFTIADAARPGIINEVAAEILRMLGREPVFQPLEWGEAQARARTDANTLITPLARTPAREPHYTWIVKVMDLEAAMGSFRQTGPLDLDGARQLPRIGVIAQSFHEAFLRSQGFNNLVHLPAARIMDALIAGEVDALYTQSLEQRWLARERGRAADLRLGPRLQAAEGFIATSRAATGVPVGEIRDAFAALESEGAVERIVRSYLG